MQSEIACTLAHYSGFGSLYSALAKPTGAIVLMYHSIATADAEDYVDPPNRLAPRLFLQQMKFLARHRRVVPLGRLIESMSSGKSLVAGSVCLTFDDGYLDNLTVAAPILARYNLPATLYLATGYVERGETQWADVLYWMFNHRTTNRLAISKGSYQEFDLTQRGDRDGARNVLHRAMLEATYFQRKEILSDLQRQLRPSGALKRVTMTWEEVRALCRCYPNIEIGGHTRDHVDLRTNFGREADLEIQGCMNDIQRETGVTPQHFSFPYGRWCSETKQTVRALGWRSAVGSSATVRADMNTDRFAIPRIEAPRTMVGLRFKTSGAYPGAIEWVRSR